MHCLGHIGDVRESGAGSFEWRIPHLLSVRGERGDYYDSPEFECCGGRWYLRVYPRGLLNFTSRDSMDLYLFRCGGSPPPPLRFTLGIRGSEGVENQRRRFLETPNDDRGCAWFEFCSRQLRLLPFGDLVLTLDVQKLSVATENSTQTEGGEEDEVRTRDKRGGEEVLKCLHKLLAEGEDADVLINVQGKEFPAHRIILRARSPVFNAMFAHDMVEKQSGVIKMEDCDTESFPDFLEHIYTGSTGMISDDNVLSLYPSADKYDLNALKEASREFMKIHLTVDSFFDTITLALKHADRELVECATEYFSRNRTEIMKTVKWETFMKENTTLANDLLLKAFAKLDEIRDEDFISRNKRIKLT